MYREASAGIESSQQRLAEFQRQVSTGKRIEKPSDDPSAAASAIAEHAEIANVEQYSRSATSVGSRLTVVDTVLSDIIEKITAASTSVMSARGTNQTPVEREAAAKTLEGIRETLFENLNTSFQGTYVFGGAETSTPPFVKDASGVVQPYAGSTAEVRVDIDRNRSVRVSMDGSTLVQTGSADDLFAVMDDAIAAARSGDNAVLGDVMGKLDTVMRRVTTAQSHVGADMNTVDDQKLRLGQMKLAATKRLDKTEAANLAEAITGMTQAQNAYEAALGAVSKVTSVSLMDYLR